MFRFDDSYYGTAITLGGNPCPSCGEWLDPQILHRCKGQKSEALTKEQGNQIIELLEHILEKLEHGC